MTLRTGFSKGPIFRIMRAQFVELARHDAVEATIAEGYRDS